MRYLLKRLFEVLGYSIKRIRNNRQMFEFPREFKPSCISVSNESLLLHEMAENKVKLAKNKYNFNIVIKYSGC